MAALAMSLAAVGADAAVADVVLRWINWGHMGRVAAPSVRAAGPAAALIRIVAEVIQSG